MEPLKILVVDDESRMRKLLKDFLSKSLTTSHSLKDKWIKIRDEEYEEDNQQAVHSVKKICT